MRPIVRRLSDTVRRLSPTRHRKDDDSESSPSVAPRGQRIHLEWERRTEDKRVGVFPKDVWRLLLQWCVNDLRTLARLIRCHPLFYVLSHETAVVRAVLELPVFCESLGYKPMAYSKFGRECKHVANHTVTDHHDGRGSVGEVVVANNQPMNDQVVSFLLKSDFHTATYVSYFNFELLHFQKDGTHSSSMHYFVDGDLWDVSYDYQRRQAARWKERDVITMHVYARAPQDFPRRKIKSYFDPKGKVGDREVVSKHRPAAMLSHKEYDAGWRIFVNFYKNGTLVHWPIEVDCGANIPAYIGLKFCELKDCVEIVPNPPTLDDNPPESELPPPRRLSNGGIFQ